ncbi:MAG: DUF1129 domain-containing protein [Clostridium sp.]|jgi:uncharacterized membrane-anchored protein|uniref:DUF1129 family protein n=1 Tax=Clostridium sp. TaxID=1506 RepID=UPI0025C090A0|nr:DUF1129 family protein [Clostridium sp.]MCH3963927.1 DUF1129 domain-containing protein [Clostridium sp.]MCI1716128.1 DUF1129 domain-containing protein [Clostridium sp.]MCI1800632.1 DUF1129 domain-containing protein [Clostridium sp.]MCI1814305.1 DUF1129 domain-containing protein [Clostridium sp.]MCI1871204.1 DUF1129 domain-containing protein [Clostridium sp.]
MNKQNNSVKKAIETNNQLRKKLTDENKEYYEQLLVYIRSAGLFYDDCEIENLLLQILQDIISAQEDGQSAEEFFGKRPQLAVDELIHNLGKASRKETLKLVGLVFGISSFFELLGALTSPDKGINLLVLIIYGMLSFLFVGIVFFIIHRSIYTKIIKGKVASFLFTWLICSLIIGSFILIERFIPPLFTLHLSNIPAILIISMLLIGSVVLVLIHSKQDGRMWWPFLPFVWISGLIGIASRLPMTENWMSSSNGKITSAVLTGFGFIIFWGLTYLCLREKKG